VEILIPADRIQHRIVEIAREIAHDYAGRPVTIVGVLTGSLMFVADLVRHLTLPLRIHFIQASSYRGTDTDPGELRVHLDFLPDLRGRHVLLLDDILDTGFTLHRLKQEMHKFGVASLKVAVLVRKAGRLRVPVTADYCGFDIPDSFVVGYGLDFNDEYRNLPHIAVLAVAADTPPEGAPGGEPPA
jgi:hypoxanthine phosphoribosyltransferase